MPDSFDVSQLKIDLQTLQGRLHDWLFQQALPIWWDKGGDRAKGGFYERLNLDGSPDDINRRTRVAARQVYSYALAERMGYKGETDAVIRQGLGWLNGPARNPETGLYYAVLSAEGRVVRGAFDFYDHAFVMLALGSAKRVRPHDQSLEQAAVLVRDKLRTTYAHPSRGFEESVPRTLPLKANPHMHMFEASLAWVEAGGDLIWRQVADEIAALCLDKFLDSKTGALREFFDGEWAPMSGEDGRIVEPGHQFEWAWLFLRHARLSGNLNEIAAARRLIEIAEVHGTDPQRGVTVNAIWDDFSPKDSKARLWPQTERIKAYVGLSESTSGVDKLKAIAQAVKAARGLDAYLKAPTPGLYADMMLEDGSLRLESAPASSLYHVICAIDELMRLKV